MPAIKKMLKRLLGAGFKISDGLSRGVCRLCLGGDESRKRIVYGPYLLPAEHKKIASFRHQRERAFRYISDALDRLGLEWWVECNDAGSTPVIAVLGGKQSTWRALASFVDVPAEMVVQKERRRNLYLRCRARVIHDSVVPLGVPRRVSGNPPRGTSLRLSLYARDDSIRAVIGPEAGVVLTFRSAAGQPLPGVYKHKSIAGKECRVLRSEKAVKERVQFPIDIVYTWVDGSDPQWQEEYNKYRGSCVSRSREVEAADSQGRFASCDELRYSLRSVAEYASWVRHVWIVTAGQRPAWLADSDWISIVDHADIFPDRSVLPTFSSRAIEACLHRINGLSEHFLYLNDDVFFGAPVSPEQFFTSDGLAKVFVSRVNSVEDSEPSTNDLSPDVGAKNGRAVIQEHTSVRISYKYLHAPHALSKSLISELVDRFPDMVARTRASRFRSLDGVVLAGWFHHSFALAMKRAVRSSISYRYVNLDDPSWTVDMEALTCSRPADVFCVNTVYSAPPAETLMRYLEDYFPWKGTFECENYRTDGESIVKC